MLDGRFPYPACSNDVHHEIELVVALGPGGKVFGHAVGLDMTRRDLQAAAKSGRTAVGGGEILRLLRADRPQSPRLPRR